MADFAPPSGPPPPHVPEGWKALWNDQYHEWFYVNLYTKQSQWDKPTEPVYSSPAGGPPSGPPPPGYNHNDSQHTGPEKGGYLASNNPYGATSSQNVSDDEAYARKLQQEEDARVRAAGVGGSDHRSADGYYGGAAQYGQGASQYGQATPQYGQATSQYGQATSQYGQSSAELPARDAAKSKGGLLGKLLSKASAAGSSSRPHQSYGGYPQQQGYGGYPQQHGYGGYPQQHGYGGGYGHAPKKSGMGAGGAAALGVGGGLIGGMMLADAMDDDNDGGYGGDDGGDYGGDDGGDDGGE